MGQAQRDEELTDYRRALVRHIEALRVWFNWWRYYQRRVLSDEADIIWHVRRTNTLIRNVKTDLGFAIALDVGAELTAPLGARLRSVCRARERLVAAARLVVGDD